MHLCHKQDWSNHTRRARDFGQTSSLLSGQVTQIFSYRFWLLIIMLNSYFTNQGLVVQFSSKWVVFGDYSNHSHGWKLYLWLFYVPSSCCLMSVYTLPYSKLVCSFNWSYTASWLTLQCSPWMESWWSVGENMGVFGFNSYIYKAKRNESRLWRPRDSIIKEEDSWGFLHPDTQGYGQTVQVVSRNRGFSFTLYPFVDMWTTRCKFWRVPHLSSLWYKIQFDFLSLLATTYMSFYFA